MATQTKGATSKGANKRSALSSRSSSSSKPKTKPRRAPAPTQHRPKPTTVSDKKKKPPHLRYTEKELKVPQLNGILPAGVQKPPNAKKGKTFVDDKESMNAILATVMAEKEGNIESKMMRARQMEEVREARRLEAEKKTQSKKQGLEERKNELKKAGRKRRRSDDVTPDDIDTSGVKTAAKKHKKRVSFD